MSKHAAVRAACAAKDRIVLYFEVFGNAACILYVLSYSLLLTGWARAVSGGENVRENIQDFLIYGKTLLYKRGVYLRV